MSAETENIQAADKGKLDQIVEKDSKTGRSLSGFWRWFTSGIGIGMVLFYMWCAATPVDTQYFLGFYVLVTYVLVFINYPFTNRPINSHNFYVDAAIPFLAVGMSVYFALHFLLGTGGAEAAHGFNIIYAVISVAVAVVFFAPVKYWGYRGESGIIALDLFLALAATFVVGYFIMEYEAINYRMGSETALDTAVSVVGILVSLEVARRVLGWSMTIVGLVFLSYALWGDLLHHIPILDAFAHTGFALDRALNHIYFKQEGVFGIMATVLVTYVILFIFFGAFLKSSGASRFFLDLPMALAGRTVGGPAKVAVMASGFFGSVSGSAIANTVSTGAFTIPLMKRAGFRPHVAGAIEPSASIGGMFMPPIMGAGGFIMAEMTEIPYVDIMLMAIFPAVIYFLSVFVMIHFEAKRYGLVGLLEEDAPTALDIIKTQWFMSFPLLAIVVLMLMAFSPGMAAYWAILTCVIVSWLDKDMRKGLLETLRMVGPAVAVFLPYAISGQEMENPLVLIPLGVAVWLILLFLTKGANRDQESGKMDWPDFLVTAIPSLILALGMVRYLDNPPNAAFWAFVTYGLVSLAVRDKGKRFQELKAPMIEGAKNTLIIGATVGVIGIIVGTIQLTGIGLKFSQIIIDLSFGYLPLAILLIGLASLVLGMGVPVTAAYLITAVLAVGAVSDMISQSLWGVSFQELQLPLGELLPDDPDRALILGKVTWALIASHMIVYWFSQDSNITPPVCVAAYAGAAIAGSDPWKTGWTSFKFAKMLYIGPFLFAFSPAFLLGGPEHIVPWWEVIISWITIILGTIAFGSLTMGYFMCPTNIFEWIIAAFATAILFFPDLLSSWTPLSKLVVDFIGIGLWVLVYVMQKIRIKANPDLTLPINERQQMKQAAA
jgi:TRAP-type uncharacterized transport system fused permease subunit